MQVTVPPLWVQIVAAHKGPIHSHEPEICQLTNPICILSDENPPCGFCTAKAVLLLWSHISIFGNANFSFTPTVSHWRQAPAQEWPNWVQTEETEKQKEMQWINFWNSQPDGHPLFGKALPQFLGSKAWAWPWGCSGTNGTGKERNNQALIPKWSGRGLDLFSSKLNHHHHPWSSMIILFSKSSWTDHSHWLRKARFFGRKHRGALNRVLHHHQYIIIVIIIHIVNRRVK